MGIFPKSRSNLTGQRTRIVPRHADRPQNTKIPLKKKVSKLSPSNQRNELNCMSDESIVSELIEKEVLPDLTKNLAQVYTQCTMEGPTTHSAEIERYSPFTSFQLKQNNCEGYATSLGHRDENTPTNPLGCQDIQYENVSGCTDVSAFIEVSNELPKEVQIELMRIELVRLQMDTSEIKEMIQELKRILRIFHKELSLHKARQFEPETSNRCYECMEKNHQRIQLGELFVNFFILLAIFLYHFLTHTIH